MDMEWHTHLSRRKFYECAIRSHMIVVGFESHDREAILCQNERPYILHGPRTTNELDLYL